MYVKPVENREIERKKQVSQPIVDKKYHMESMDGEEVSNRVDTEIQQVYEHDSSKVHRQMEVSSEKLRKILKQLAEQMPNAQAQFGIHEETNRMMIKLVDKDTKEVIKEFPPEENLDGLAKRLEIAGILMDKRL